MVWRFYIPFLIPRQIAFGCWNAAQEFLAFRLLKEAAEVCTGYLFQMGKESTINGIVIKTFKTIVIPRKVCVMTAKEIVSGSTPMMVCYSLRLTTKSSITLTY